MNTVQRVVKNTFFLFLSNMLQKFFSLFIIIFVAQKLGVGDFGVYSFVFSFVVLFTVFTDFGVGVLIFRDVSKDKARAKDLLGKAFGMKLFLAVLSCVVVFLVIFGMHLMAPEKYPQIIVVLVSLAGISMALDSLAGLFHMAFFAFERMEYDFLSNLAYRFFLFVVVLAALFLGYGLFVIVALTTISSFFNLLFSYIFCAKKIALPKISFNLKEAWLLLLASLPFCLLSVFSSLYSNIGTVMLSFFHGNIEVAYFSAASRLVNALAFVPTAFMSSVFPVMAALFAKKSESLGNLLEHSIKYMFLVILPIAFGTTLLAGQIISTIYPTTATNNFAPATTALQLLIWFSVFSFVNIVLLNALSSTAFEKRTSLLLGITVLIHIVLNFILIPKYGFNGVAASMVIAESFFFVSGIAATNKRLYKIDLLRIISKPLIASIIMSAFILLFKQLPFFSIIFFSAIVYFVALFALRTFNEQDYQIFSKLFKRK